MRNAKSLRASALLGALALSSAFAQAAVVTLPALNVDKTQISVSGLSSGGFMANQLGYAYSSTFMGVGVFAAGPYMCAGQNNYTACMYNATISASQLSTMQSSLNNWSGSYVDALSNVARQKTFVFVGSSDATVGPKPTTAAATQYTNNGVPAANQSFVQRASTAHVFPTDFDSTGNNSCSSSASPYISNCGYDGAKAMFTQFYGALNARNNAPAAGNYIEFDQTPFINGNPGMAASGWAYIPANCKSGASCKLHVALHGCQQNYATIGDKYLKSTGITRWADTNSIIVLFPQTKVDNTSRATAASGSLANPNGCWDWIGWYGSDFARNTGVQMKALKAMVDKVASGSAGTTLTAPTGLAVNSTTSNSATLSWSTVSGAAGYNVFRNGTKVNASAVTATSYTDTGLASSTTYTWTVAAVDSTGAQGATSPGVSGTTAAGGAVLPAPTGLAVSSVTSSSAVLNWGAVTGATSYNVFRNGTKVGSATSTSYTDAGLAASTVYSWSVAAVDSSGVQGTTSAVVSGTTAAAATCYTASNYAHTTAGRAYNSGGYALANGSKQNMGLWNSFVTTTLKMTGPNYYVIGTCP